MDDQSNKNVDIFRDRDNNRFETLEDRISDRYLLHVSLFVLIALIVYLILMLLAPKLILQKELAYKIPNVEATTTTSLVTPREINKTDILPGGLKYDEALAKQTFETECVKCHGWQEGILTADGQDVTMKGFFLKHFPRTKSEWQTTVQKMQDYGADLTQDQSNLIIEYLYRNWSV